MASFKVPLAKLVVHDCKVFWSRVCPHPKFLTVLKEPVGNYWCLLMFRQNSNKECFILNVHEINPSKNGSGKNSLFQ